MKSATGVLSAIVVLCAAQSAFADEVSFSGSSGSLSSEVTFQTSGSNLIVTLTNTSTTDALVPTDILTGVFFNAPVTLTTVSATTSGSVYNYPGVTNVGGEWAYTSGFSGPAGSNQGISASGLGLFGPTNNFGSTNLSGPPSGEVGGVDFGIAPAGDNPLTENGGLSGEGLIKNSVTFVLSGWSGSLASITDVWFQYGTSLTEPGFGGSNTPEPATMVLMGVGAAGLWFARRRKQIAA
jgi:hypothetical protein